MKICLSFVLCLLAVEVSFSAPAPAPFLKLLGPVLFSTNQAQAAKAAPEARAILTKFQKAGYSPALWTVGALPAETNAIKDWFTNCIAAFPEPPILAIDPLLISSVERHASSLEVFLPLALPRVHSVMIDYSHFDNLANFARPAPDIALVQQNVALVRKSAQAMGRPVFLWLHVDDGLVPAVGMKEWVEKLAPLVDGFEVFRWHEWNAGPAVDAQSLAIIRQTGKPVLRGGFQYMSPRLRPGIENDLMDMYKERMKSYEAWVKEAGFAGYEREIGNSIPGDVSPNMTLLEEK